MPLTPTRAGQARPQYVPVPVEQMQYQKPGYAEVVSPPPTKKPPRPCKYCQGEHYDEKCPTRYAEVNANANRGGGGVARKVVGFEGASEVLYRYPQGDHRRHHQAKQTARKQVRREKNEVRRSWPPWSSKALSWLAQRCRDPTNNGPHY